MILVLHLFVVVRRKLRGDRRTAVRLVQQLPAVFKGTENYFIYGEGRVGVFRIGDFIENIQEKDPNFSMVEWFQIPEHFLAEVTNGRCSEMT